MKMRKICEHGGFLQSVTYIYIYILYTQQVSDPTAKILSLEYFVLCTYVAGTL